MDSSLNWYAARIISSRKYVLELLGHDNMTSYSARILPNVLFIQCTEAYTRELAYNCYGKLIFYRNPEQTAAQAINEKEMRNFMLISSAPENCLISLDNVDKTFLQGQRVRVTGGYFAGAEGIIKRIKGDRRLVVSLDGVACVATSFIHPSLLEKIEG